jgi:hypothetical protein
VEWLVQVSGESFDLDFIVDKFNYGRVLITKDMDSYVLKADELNEHEEYQEVKPKAIEIFHRVNGILKAFQLVKDLKFEGIYGIKPDGGKVVFEGSTITARSRLSANAIVVRLDNSIFDDTPVPTEGKWLVQATKNREIDTVIRLVSKDCDSWVGLSRIMDVIEMNGGGERGLIRKGWITDEENSKFGRSANNPSISGDESRHGKDTLNFVLPKIQWSLTKRNHW